MAVLEMTDKINKAMKNNQFSTGVFVDLSKAFETLNHNILLNKLYYYGIRGVAYEWFKSYLSNRLQYGSMYILMDIHPPVSPSCVESLKAQFLDRCYS